MQRSAMQCSAAFKHYTNPSLPPSLVARSKTYNPTKTGMFGLGFNSVYHVTEVPMFVTGKHFVVLDPQAKYVPGATAHAAGLETEWATEDYSAVADQFEPFNMPCFGCDMTQKAATGAAGSAGAGDAKGQCDDSPHPLQF